MLSRHQVRQAVVQFLYGLTLDSLQSITDADIEAIWDIILEPDRAALDKARVKAITHLTRDLPDKIRLFQTRADNTLKAIEGNPALSDFRDMLTDLIKREQSLDASVRSLRSAKKTDPTAETRAMEAAYNSLQIINSTLLQIRPSLIAKLEDYPQFRFVMDPLKSSISKLQDISSRISGLENPEGHKNATEFAPVIETSQEMCQLRTDAGELLRKVLANIEDLDQLISDKLENFSPERISPVDRSILRLAAYELKYRKDLATPIVVKEAIRLAEDYSTSEAPRFVNGILTGIATSCRN
ncbi:transcription antitermination factor NusB [Akkermansia sp. N21169]|uniref:transcription antitermination factor NusB n=1 Tax=Akkermansia sp. N21169 TaxID=3040765 RepID=UPI00244E8610|nr:transcription antitermination factor NusB [Akkermansia sp. N21169]MDH3069147.1 transcription antitermination factor NusB [Akkermansia sp. N21169]